MPSELKYESLRPDFEALDCEMVKGNENLASVLTDKDSSVELATWIVGKIRENLCKMEMKSGGNEKENWEDKTREEDEVEEKTEAPVRALFLHSKQSMSNKISSLTVELSKLGIPEAQEFLKSPSSASEEKARISTWTLLLKLAKMKSVEDTSSTSSSKQLSVEEMSKDPFFHNSTFSTGGGGARPSSSELSKYKFLPKEFQKSLSEMMKKIVISDEKMREMKAMIDAETGKIGREIEEKGQNVPEDSDQPEVDEEQLKTVVDHMIKFKSVYDSEYRRWVELDRTKPKSIDEENLRIAEETLERVQNVTVARTRIQEGLRKINESKKAMMASTTSSST